MLNGCNYKVSPKPSALAIVGVIGGDQSRIREEASKSIAQEMLYLIVSGSLSMASIVNGDGRYTSLRKIKRPVEASVLA